MTFFKARGRNCSRSTSAAASRSPRSSPPAWALSRRPSIRCSKAKQGSELSLRLFGPWPAYDAVSPFGRAGGALLFLDQQALLLGQFPIGFRHHAGELLEGDLGFPFKDPSGLARIA